MLRKRFIAFRYAIQRLRTKDSKRGRNLMPGIIGLVICGIAVVVVFVFPRGVQRIRNEVIYRVPFVIPGVPVCPDCNIILVSLDTLRADDLPCYGYARNTAPNLCAFSERNVQFNRFYSESSNTLDSHMSIFTGLYPSTHHMINEFEDVLNPKIRTLTEVLANNGYKTIYAGATSDPNLPLTLGLGRGFSEVHAMDSRRPGWRSAYERLLPELTGTKPTFLFLHTYAVHDPYIAGHGPRRYVPGSIPKIAMTADEFPANSIEFYRFALQDYTNRLSASDTEDSNLRSTFIVDALQRAIATQNVTIGQKLFETLPPYESYKYWSDWYWYNVDKKNPEQIAYLQGLYDERINTLDADLTSLIEFVSRPEVKRRTIVIFTADHGEEFMEHGYVTHSVNLYNTATHVPFIIAAPHMRSGWVDALAQSIDIYPTILALIGITAPGPLEGNSLLPFLMDTFLPSGDSYVISEHRDTSIRSIQDGTWKLYVNINKYEGGALTGELYNLAKDPLEQHNVIAIHPDIQTRLMDALLSALSKSPYYEPIRGEFPTWIDQKIRKELIKEGYF